MPSWDYSVKFRDETLIAKASARDVPISYRKMVDLVALLRGKKLSEAREILQRVIEKKEAVPIRRYHGKQAHRRGLADKAGWPVGRYPVKAAKYLLKLLDNVENNAIDKGLDVDRLKIIHMAVHKAITLKRYMPRAFGRSTPRFKHYSHVEIVVKEV